MATTRNGIKIRGLFFSKKYEPPKIKATAKNCRIIFIDSGKYPAKYTAIITAKEQLFRKVHNLATIKTFVKNDITKINSAGSGEKICRNSQKLINESSMPKTPFPCKISS